MKTLLMSRQPRRFLNLVVILIFLFSQLSASFQAAAASGREAHQKPSVAMSSPVAPSAQSRTNSTEGSMNEVKNLPPEILQGSFLPLMMNSPADSGSLQLTLDAVDPDNSDILTWSLMTPAKHGAASVEGLGDSARVGYVPEEGYQGVDVFAVEVSDPHGGKDTIILEVTIGPANSPDEGISASDSRGDFHVPDPELPEQELSSAAGSPYIKMLMGQNLNGYYWPLGHSLTLTIDDASNGTGVDHTQTKTVVADPQSPSQTRVDFDWPSFGVDLGDIVTMTDGTTPKTLTMALSVSSYDTAGDTIGGTSLYGNVVWVYVFASHWVQRCAVLDGSGNWSVSFASGDSCSSELVDLVPGMQFQVLEWDPDQDNTQGTYNLKIKVKRNDNWIQGESYPHGKRAITLTIDDPSNGTGVDYTSKVNDSFFIFSIPEADFKLAPGQLVTVTDGLIVKTHIITTLQVTAVNTFTDTISGVAEPGRVVYTGMVCNGICTDRLVTANGSGQWSAKFGVPGPNFGEEDTVNLTAGTGSWAEERDTDGDFTTVYWHGLNPYLTVYILKNEIYGRDWALGSTATLTIDDPDNGIGTDYTDSVTVVPDPSEPLSGQVWFTISGFTLEAGQVVTISDGVTTKTHTITGLTVTGADPDTDTVSGTAAPGSQVEAGWLCNTSICTHRLVTANGSGDWTAKYSVAGAHPDELDIFNIVPGSGSTARQSDADNDSTSVDWQVPSPTISGTVRDEGGDPITGVAVQVRAVLKSDGSELASTLSNPADGTYQLTGLPYDMELAVIASDEYPDVDGYAGEYYDNVDALDWSEGIVLSSGAPDRSGVDFKLSSGLVTAEHLTFNTGAGRLLSDVDLRKAIAFGTDRQAILDNAFVPSGYTGEVLNTMVMPGVWYEAPVTDPQLTVYDYNPTTAEGLLSAAGWVDTDADGIRENASNEELVLDLVTTMATARVASADLFKTQMADIGIMVNIATYSGADFFSGDPLKSPLASGDFDMAEFAWDLSDKDNLLPVYNTGDGQNTGGYSNATLDGYYDTARGAKVGGDSTTFLDNALNWQYTFTDDLPALPFFTRMTPPVISGKAGVAFATLSYTDGTPMTVTADASGMYTLTVSYNWSGTVTPSKIGYTFTPSSKSYTNVLSNQSGQNYTATAVTYTISGNVGVAGVTLSYSGGSAVTDGNGDYSFTVPYNWSGTVTPSKVGYTFSPDHRDYTNTLSDRANEDYVEPTWPNWYGGAVVTADQNVVTVGRPHIGSEVASYNGFSSGSTTQYVPMLFKQMWGSYDSALYIQNTDTTNTANITIKFYDPDGVLNCTKTDSIPKMSSHGYWLPSETCLPTNWYGGVVVTSDRNIVAVGRPHIGNQVMTYNGFSSGSLSMYVPMLFKQMWGYDSAFYVQNTDAVNSANVTIKFYDPNGVLNCTKTDTIPKLSSHGYWLPFETCLPANWYGGVVVTSDRNIVAVGRPHLGSEITTYNGFAGGSTTMYAPMLFKRFNGSYDSALYIQNVDPTNMATISIKFYDQSGVLTYTQPDTISPGSSKGYWLPDISGLPATWEGSVKVESDYPVVGIARPHLGSSITAYDGFTGGGTMSSVPMLFKQMWGSYDSALYMENISPTTTANVTVKFYDVNGNLSCVRNDTISAMGVLDYWLPSLTCSP